jgi:AcrR family transcriptional regulator
MNYPTATRDALLRAAQTLFAERGYDGTSIRAVTSLANANLGAVTYHFRSKDGLYEAVAESLVRPMRERIVAESAAGGTPLERIELLVRAVFEHLQANRDLPQFIIQLLAGSRPLPDVMAQMLRANHALMVEIIAAGQSDGTIRAGNARLMALSIIAQPIWLSIVRSALRQAIELDQDDQHTRAEIVDNAIRFIHAGLAPLPEEP